MPSRTILRLRADHAQRRRRGHGRPEDLDRFFRVATAKQVGVIAMKVVGRGALIKPGLDVRRLLHYVLSYPVSTAIVGISALSHLEENVRVARAFEPLGEKEMAEVRAAARS